MSTGTAKSTVLQQQTLLQKLTHVIGNTMVTGQSQITLQTEALAVVLDKSTWKDLPRSKSMRLKQRFMSILIHYYHR
jgi:hypothetical protein